MPQKALSPVGEILRTWRAVRGKSQLDLALDADVSPRHLSFIETGRASPSRDMLGLLSEVLDIPLRERNALLQAAGFAAVYRETPLSAPPMEHVRVAIDAILNAHTKSPAMLVNRRYDVLQTNVAAQRLLAGMPTKRGQEHSHSPNLLRLILSPDCLRPAIVNWPELLHALICRVWRETYGLSGIRHDVLNIIDEYLPGQAMSVVKNVDWSASCDVVLPMRIRTAANTLALFSTITTLGTPTDITLQDLRIEAFHPADAQTDEFLARVGAT